MGKEKNRLASVRGPIEDTFCNCEGHLAGIYRAWSKIIGKAYACLE